MPASLLPCWLPCWLLLDRLGGQLDLLQQAYSFSRCWNKTIKTVKRQHGSEQTAQHRLFTASTIHSIDYSHDSRHHAHPPPTILYYISYPPTILYTIL
jgi:hypothetical protein